MRTWVGAAAVAAVLAAAGPGIGSASATDRHAAPACSPSGTSLALTASGHKFDKDCLAVTAGESFTIRFDNQDSDRHNVSILPSHTSPEALFQGNILPGPKSDVYAVERLVAGTYHFHCDVHPNLMNGTFVVAAAPKAADAAEPVKPAPTPAPAEPTPSASAAPAAPKAAAGSGSDAAPAPKAAPPAATPAPARSAAAAGTAPGAATGALPHTGPGSSRLFLLLAGIAFALGGLSVAGGARRVGG